MSFTAQPNGPRGLSPVKAQSGTPTRSNTYQVAGNGSDKFYSGQPLKLDTNGQLVILSGAGDTVVGVADGVEYVDVNGDIKFGPVWPAPGSVFTGTVVKVRVYDGADELFNIFANADLELNDIGASFDFDTVAGTGGDDSTGKSSLSLDVSSKNASPAGKQVILRAISDRPGDARSAIVQFVDPQFAAQLA
jgi:hypothetical protein